MIDHWQVAHGGVSTLDLPGVRVELEMLYARLARSEATRGLLRAVHSAEADDLFFSMPWSDPWHTSTCPIDSAALAVFQICILRPEVLELWRAADNSAARALVQVFQSDFFFAAVVAQRKPALFIFIFDRCMTSLMRGCT